MVAGVDEETAAAWVVSAGDEDETQECVVWACNMPALRLFLDLKTQWARGAFGGFIGLRYEAIPPFLTMAGVRRKEWPDLFAKLRAMEAAALPILNEE